MKAKSIQKGKLRWYPCPKCGDQHPSITTILDVVGSKALMGWMAKNGTAKLNVYARAVAGYVADDLIKAINRQAEEHWKLTEKTAFWKSGQETGEEAADYGTLAHAWIEAHLEGKEVTLESLPEPAHNSVVEFMKWEREHSLKTIATEQTFYNCRLNYACTSDWLGKLDGELSLGDWKTSTGIFFNYIVQAWGNALADETQNADRLYSQVFIGRFGKDGTSEIRVCKRNEFPSIETAREILIACGHIFKALQDWDEKFPYKKTKPTEVKTNVLR